VKCHPCGQDNASSALFCTACRRPLVAPSKLPTRLEPMAQPARAMAGAAAPVDSSYGGAAGAPSARNRFAPPEAGRASRMGSDSDILAEDEAWAAVIGDANTHHYLTRFERLARGGSGGWHWPAFFVAWYWMLYRKMWRLALIYFVILTIGQIFVKGLTSAAPGLAALNLLWLLGTMIVPGLMANGWYFRHCENKIRDVRARGGSKDQLVARLEAAGGTSGIAVFVVVALIIVMVIGILAAVALPAYQTYTIKAKVSEAIPVGADVAAAVGQHYEQTGQLPSQADVDGFLQRAAHHSQYVSGVDLESSTGTLKVHVSARPAEGSFQLVPSSDNNHHLSWTCTSADGLKRYLPASCRN
jgi:Tfp pilus assembly protein PilE